MLRSSLTPLPFRLPLLPLLLCCVCSLLPAALCFSLPPPPPPPAAPIVRLDYVALSGVSNAASGVTSFKGIPYAEPPLGPLRFLPPLPHRPIAGLFNASAFGPMCPGGFGSSANKPASEDCLFINVWLPSSALPAADWRRPPWLPRPLPLLPVMVWIHGGGLSGDSTQKYDAEKFVSHVRDTVVVSMEYRLGMLGFFSNEAVLAEGHGANHGLLDQRLALQWVQKYIVHFGGNPGHVTLWGQSAGAKCVGLHMLAYGGSQYGLFHRAVMESGAWPTFQSGCEQAKRSASIARAVGCNATVGAAQLSCLRAVPYADLLAASAALAWNPAIDHAMFPAAPFTLLTTGRVMRVPLLIGTVTNEGLGFAPSTLSQATVMRAYDVSAENATALLALYPLSAFPARPPLPQQLLASVEMCGDFTYVCPSELFARLSSAVLPMNTFRYRWNYHAHTLDNVTSLVPHFTEVAFLFNYTGGLLTPYEFALSDVIQRLWAAFAGSAIASPNSRPPIAGVPLWPPFNAYTQFAQLLFDANETVTTELDGAYMPNHSARCALWTQLFAQNARMLEKHDQSCPPA